MNTRCGLAARITAIAPLPGSNSDRPVHVRSAATTSASPVRMQAFSCSVPSPRSNRTAERSCARRASVSGPISVRAVRRSIAQMSSGRHNETRWLQLCVVSDSEATGRISSCATIRKPPRAVMADDRAADASQDDVFVGVAHEFGDRAEAADTPGCLSIGQMTGKKVGLVIWFVHVPPAALVKIGGLAKDNAPTSRRTPP